MIPHGQRSGLRGRPGPACGVWRLPAIEAAAERICAAVCRRGQSMTGFRSAPFLGLLFAPYPLGPSLGVRANRLPAPILWSPPALVRHGIAAGLAAGRPAEGTAHGGDHALVSGA